LRFIGVARDFCSARRGHVRVKISSDENGCFKEIQK
jgi:hypothetical protein